MKICALFLLIVVLGPVVFPPALSGGPPFFTDDPAPLAFRQWEFYVASQDVNTKTGLSGTAPHFELNYGASSNLMLHIITPLNYSKPRGAGALYGLGDIELGFKYRFVKEKGAMPEVGTFPHLEVPTGSRRRGLGNGRPQVFIPIWVLKSFGPWATYGGAGLWTNPGPGNRNYWAYGWEVQRELSKVVTIGAEIFGNTETARGEGSRTGLNFGAILTPSRGQSILLSAGRDIHGPSRFSIYVAYYRTFGPQD